MRLATILTTTNAYTPTRSAHAREPRITGGGGGTNSGEFTLSARLGVNLVQCRAVTDSISDDMTRKGALHARRRAGSRLVRVLTLLAIASLAACGGLPPRNPPRVDVVVVELERIDGPQAFFGITLQLTNDGDDDIVINAMQGALSIEDESIAQAALVSAPVRVPAHGGTRAQLRAQTGMDAILRAIASAMRRGATLVAPGGRPTLRYSITGSATLNGGYRLPFSRAGELG